MCRRRRHQGSAQGFTAGESCSRAANSAEARARPGCPALPGIPCSPMRPRERARVRGRETEFIRNYSQRGFPCVARRHRLRILKALARRTLRPSSTSTRVVLGLFGRPSSCRTISHNASYSLPYSPPSHAALVSSVLLAGPLPVILSAIGPRAPSCLPSSASTRESISHSSQSTQLSRLRCRASHIT